MSIKVIIVFLLIGYLAYLKGYKDGKIEVYDIYSLNAINVCIMGKPYAVIYKYKREEEFIIVEPFISNLDCKREYETYVKELELGIKNDLKNFIIK